MDGFLVINKQKSWTSADVVNKIKRVLKIKKDKIEKILKDFTGKISQTPPAYSAVKVDGVRAYELARKGKDVQIKPRDIIIQEISLTKINIPFIAFNVVCSKGTYIRSLCSDIGERLGTAAHMFSLIRTASGKFKINDAVNIDDLGKGRIIKIDAAFGFMPGIRIKKGFEDKVKNGMPITAFSIEKASAGFSVKDKVRIYSDEKLMAVGIARFNSLKK